MSARIESVNSAVRAREGHPDTQNQQTDQQKNQDAQKDTVPSMSPTKCDPIDGFQVLTQAISRVENYARQANRDLKFVFDEDSGAMIVRVIDGQTLETIRTMSPEEMIKTRDIIETAKGLLFKKKV